RVQPVPRDRRPPPAPGRRARGGGVVLMRALAILLALLAGCITPRPPVRYEQPLQVTVALVRDDVLHKASYDVPDAVRAAVEHELVARNLRPTLPPFDEAFARVRDSQQRLELAAKAPADLVVLVETQAAFYAQIEGSW